MSDQLDEYEKFLSNAINVLEDELMDIEMLLQDALVEATNKFKQYTKDFNDKINEKTNILVNQQLLSASEEFFGDLKTHGLSAQETFLKWFDETYADGDVPDNDDLNNKIDLLTEKESIQGYLDTFKDHLDSGIAKCEKDIK
jgi:hypothetical protein